MSTVSVKIDEDLPTEIAALVRAAGHDAKTVAEQHMLGCSDDRLWEAIVGEKRLLITADTGFADARRVAAAPESGIILLRLPKESRRGYLGLFSEFVAGFALTQVAGCVVTVTPEAVRVHDTRRIS